MRDRKIIRIEYFIMYDQLVVSYVKFYDYHNNQCSQNKSKRQKGHKNFIVFHREQIRQKWRKVA